MDEKTPVEDAEVLLIARMPHHDRSLEGGHGLANDPDVAGIKATPAGAGRYTVSTADFSMGGPWLFEIQVKKDDELVRAYFATVVGEE